MSAVPDAHQIRLAGPWQTKVESGSRERRQLPFCAAGDNTALTVYRSFNGSEGILAAPTVRIRIQFEGSEPSVQLNQQVITTWIETGNAGHLEFDVTHIIQKSNSLMLTCCRQSGDRITDICLLVFDE